MRQAQLNQQKISTIETMDELQLNSELKKLQLATYGNRQEKMKRLKKFHGVEAMRSPQNSLFFKDRARPKSSVVQEIEQMKQRRVCGVQSQHQELVCQINRKLLDMLE